MCNIALCSQPKITRPVHPWPRSLQPGIVGLQIIHTTKIYPPTLSMLNFYPPPPPPGRLFYLTSFCEHFAYSGWKSLAVSHRKLHCSANFVKFVLRKRKWGSRDNSSNLYGSCAYCIPLILHFVSDQFLKGQVHENCLPVYLLRN